MGWTWYRAEHYKGNKIDRKAECDAYFMEGLNRGHYEVLKSAMVGKVYYAAVKGLKKYIGKNEYENIPEEEQRVFAVVFLTGTDMREYFNFGYKDMDETVEPCYYDCPKSILKLLTKTDNESALMWRKKCYKTHEDKKNNLGKLPVGTIIEFQQIDGKSVRLQKHEAAYQFKTPFWWNGKNYFQKSHIPKNYTILNDTEL